MERIRDETATLVANLGVNTRFTLVEFARNYAFFSPTLIPSTKANREAARRWLHTYFAVNGTFPQSTPGAVTGSPGFLVLLEAVFRFPTPSLWFPTAACSEDNAVTIRSQSPRLKPVWSNSNRRCHSLREFFS
jgi:hypothetical protein